MKRHEKQRGEEQTTATLPIQYNVVLIREAGEKDGEKLGAFVTTTSLRHPVVSHGLVSQIGEIVEPTISLEIVTHVLEV
jgi:hypothetical protein